MANTNQPAPQTTTYDFDAKAYMDANNLIFQGLGEQEGSVNIVDQNGREGVLDLKGLLAQSGIQNAEITYNSPSTALQDSPVGIIDRFKMAFGDEKGNKEYLRGKFQDAQVDGNGDMIVKDKGAWYRVDPTGFSRGDGWSLAETVADVVDLSRDAVVGTAGALGATAGLFGTGGVGTVAGASAGAGAASAASTALGRIMGTFSDDPASMVSQIGLDTVLGAAGETVALGAKSYIAPAIKNALAKFGSAEIPAASRTALAQTLEQTTTVPSAYWEHGMAHPQPVGAILDSVTEASKNGSSLRSGNAFATELNSAVQPGSQEAFDIAARQRLAQPVGQLIGMGEGAVNPQRLLSGQYRAGRSAIIEGVDESAEMMAGEKIGKNLGDLNTRLNEFNLVDRVKSAKTGKVELIGDEAFATALNGGADPIAATQTKQALERYLTNANRIATETPVLKGKAGAEALMDTIQHFDDMYATLADSSPAFQEVIGGISQQLKGDLINVMPQSLSKPINGQTLSGPVALQNLSKFYGEAKEAVTYASKMRSKQQAGLESVVNNFETPAFRNLTPMKIMETLASLHGEARGNFLLNDVKSAQTVRKIGGVIPNGANQTRGVPKISQVVDQKAGELYQSAKIALTQGLPTARITAAAQNGPKAAFESIRAQTKGLTDAGKILRSMNESERKSVVGNPEKLSALLRTALVGLGNQ